MVVPAVVEAIWLSLVWLRLIVSDVGSDLRATSPLEVDDDGDKEEGKGDETPSLLILLELSPIVFHFVRAFCSPLPLSLPHLSSEEGGKTATTRLPGEESRGVAGGGKEDDNADGRCWW